MEIYLIIFLISLLLVIISNLWLVIVGFKRSIAWGILIFLLSPLSAIAFAATNWFDAKRSFLVYMISGLALFASGYLLVVNGLPERAEKVFAAFESGQIKENEILLYIGSDKLLPAEEVQSDVEISSDDNTELSALSASDTETDAGLSTIAPGDVAGENTEDTLSEKDASTLTETDDATSTAKDKPSALDTKSTDATASKELTKDEAKVVVEEKPVILDYPTKANTNPDPLVTPKKKPKDDSVRVSLSKAKNYIGRYFIVKTRKGAEHRGILVKVTKSRLILERKIYGGSFTYKIYKKRIKRLDMFKEEYVDEIS